MTARILALLLVLVLAGCESTGPYYRRVPVLGYGMSRREVIWTLGRPVRITREKGVETLNYSFRWKSRGALAFGSYASRSRRPTSYYVRIVHGRVDTFGRNEGW